MIELQHGSRSSVHKTVIIMRTGSMLTSMQLQIGKHLWDVTWLSFGYIRLDRW